MSDSELQDALKRSVAALQKMKERVQAVEQAAREPIAVVAMGCRFAGGASDPDALWRLLERGAVAVGPVPDDRWSASAIYDPDPAVSGKSICQSGCFLDDAFGFDAAFFGIAPREARSMDPQQRLLMEVAWEMLERAGIVPATLMGSDTGVFVGINSPEYVASHAGDLEMLDGYVITGNHPSVASGRLSYFLGLKGPSITLDSACSSSLVAVHYACQSLRAGECSLALVGGAGMMLEPTVHVEFSRLRGLAADGRCKPFEAAADGMGWGEGCGVVLLKRLSDALAAGERPLAVLRGSAVNQDGRSNGLTAPNGPSQQQVIRRALERAGVAPADLLYVEAHGTGTALGDPIEVQALSAVLREDRSPDDPVLVGSVKASIGHTMAAAGLAGLIKTILALRHGRIPPQPKFVTASPHIAWEALPVTIPRETVLLPQGRRRIAGVSSFGVSGTNCHVVVESLPAPAGASPEPAFEPPEASSDRPPERNAHLLLVSSRTPVGLQLQADAYARHLDSHPEMALADVCHAAATGRTHFEERLALVATTTEEACARLRAACSGETPLGWAAGRVEPGRRPKVAFLFTGQGSQYPDMGRELYQTAPVFRDAVDRCAAALGPFMDRPLLSVLFSSGDREPGSSSALDETCYTQPALFALEYALAELWKSWGVVPDVVMGHSVGEYVAACVAGVFGLEDGLELIAARARLMQSLPGEGAMASIRADAAIVAQALRAHGGQVSIAAYNGPESVVISGVRERVRAVCDALDARGIKTKPLRVSHASHSPLMTPILDELEEAAQRVSLHAPRSPLVSNVLGRVAADEVASSSYWRRHLREPVRFQQGMQAACDLGATTFVEIGPHPTLLSMGMQCAPDEGNAWLPSLRREQPAWPVILESLSGLHVRGVPIDWRALDAPYRRRSVLLPTYAFERETYRLERAPTRAAAPVADADANAGPHTLSGRGLDLPGDAVHRWISVGLRDRPYLAHHRIYEQPVLPGTFYIAALLAVASDVFGARAATVRDLQLLRPLIVGEETALHVVLAPAAEARDEARAAAGYDVVFYAGQPSGPRARGGWREHARAALLVGVARTQPGVETELTSPSRAAGAASLTADQVSQRLAAMGIADPAAETPLHPALIDNGFAAALLAAAPASTGAGPYLLAGVGEVRWYGASASSASVRARRRTVSGDALVADLVMTGDGGEILLDIEAVTLMPTARDTFARLTENDAAGKSALLELRWPVREPPPPPEPRSLAGERWLVLAREPRLAATLIEALAASDAEVIVARIDDGAATRAALGEGRLDGVACWWGGGDDNDPAAIGDVARAAEESAWQALGVLRALVSSGSFAGRLWWITESAQAVATGEPVSAATAALWGLGRAVASEHPTLRCALLDVQRGMPPSAPSLRAILTCLDDEPQIALRAGQRHVARLSAASAMTAPPTLADRRAAGTTLITGGFGALGLHVAEWLVRDRGARHLVLMGRRAPSPEALRRIAALRAAGAEVSAAQGDAADAADLARVLAAIAHDQPLRGIVHAGGVVAARALVDLDAGQLAAVFRPKAAGAWNLHQQTLGRQLDFFVMFSSIQALFGGATQGHYAAANAFLDGLAHQRRALGLPALSLDWGAWAGEGMAARLTEDERLRLARVGFGTLPSERALPLLARGLATGAVQLVAAAIDLDALRRAAETEPPDAIWRDLVASSPAGVRDMLPRAPASALVAKLRGLPDGERQPAITAIVRNHVAAALRMASPASLSLDRPLKEIGLDSLMALEIPNRLKQALGQPFPQTLLYDHTTVRALSAFVSRALYPEPVTATAAAPGTPRPAEPPQPPDASLDFASDEALFSLIDGATTGDP